MANITKVEFTGADTPDRKEVAHSLHALIHATMAGKRKGDHVLVHFDDGSTQQVTLRDATVAPSGVVVTVAPGVEP